MYFLCVFLGPGSCADVKYYMNSSVDGNYTIYPYATGRQPVHIYCDAMNTLEPKEYVNVLQGVGKNFALVNGDMAVAYTCDIIPDVVTTTYLNSHVGHTRYSKVCNYNVGYLFNSTQTLARYFILPKLDKQNYFGVSSESHSAGTL